MGSRTSKLEEIPKSAREILEVSDTATEQEIRSQYFKLLQKYHIDYGKEKNLEKTKAIIKAFKTLKDKNFEAEKGPRLQNIKFDKYNTKYFYDIIQMNADMFYEEVNNIYNLIEKNEQSMESKIKLPKFGDKNKKMTHNSTFYTFFKGFNTCINFEFDEDGPGSLNKELNRVRKTAYNESVRKLTQFVLMVDPRLKMNIFEISSKPIKEIKVKKPKTRIKKSAEKYAFYCDACKKGFMSENTMLNHLKSIKHKNKLEECGIEERDIEEIIKERKNNLSEATTYEESEDSKSCTESLIDEMLVEEESVLEETENIEKEEEKPEIKQLSKKISKMSVKKSKKKTVIKKKTTNLQKENEQMLTCSYCHTTFASRNKLFEHIRESHTNVKRG